MPEDFVEVSLEDAGRPMWVSLHDQAGRELELPRQQIAAGEASFEFRRAPDIGGVGFWSAASGGRCLDYKEVQVSGVDAFTVRCWFDVVIGEDIEVREETVVAQYNAVDDVHPVRDPVRVQPGRYTPKLPNPLSPNEPLTLEVDGSILWFRRAPDEIYEKTLETLVRGSNELSEVYFHSSTGHEVGVIVDFNTKVSIEGRNAFRLIDIHRLGHRVLRPK